MKKHLLILSLSLLPAAAVPAAANELLAPVASENLDQFIGTNLFGRAYANLGVVSQADLNAGVIGLTGPYGEFALIHTSMLAQNGAALRAPSLTVGDIRHASVMNLQQPGATIINPTVTVKEPPLE
jgi:hypothetical protein